VVFYFTELFPELCIFCNACIQQVSCYVFLQIDGVIGQYNFLRLDTSVSYMKHDYYQWIYYKCVTSYASNMGIILCHPLNREIELAIFVTNDHNSQTITMDQNGLHF
jgi:hypothetical protein